VTTLLTPIDKAKGYIISMLNSLPQALTMGEIKASVARANSRAVLDKSKKGKPPANYDTSLTEKAVEMLLADGKVVFLDNRYISRRHVPRFRTLDADWQW